MLPYNNSESVALKEKVIMTRKYKILSSNDSNVKESDNA